MVLVGLPKVNLTNGSDYNNVLAIISVNLSNTQHHHITSYMYREKFFCLVWRSLIEMVSIEMTSYHLHPTEPHSH